MKRKLIGLAVIAWSLSAHGQGTVIFNNRIPGVVDARVMLSDGTGAGEGWVAQLYGGPASTPVSQLQPLTPIVSFRTSSSAAYGYVNPTDIVIPGVSSGSQATIVMRAFMSGTTYETSLVRGESNPINVTVGGGLVPSGSLIGLESFGIGPSSSAISITASTDGHGSVTPESAFSLAGGSQTFTASPDPGFDVNQWSVDGSVAQSGGVTFTLADIQMNHAISVEFKELETGGVVVLNNRISGIVDARVVLSNGRGAGEGWTAQLYGAALGQPLAPLSPTTTFRTSSEAAMGYVNPVDVIVPGVNPGQSATLVMVVFNGATFETSTRSAESAPITITLGGGTLPPANLLGLEGFTLPNEPITHPDGGLISFNNRVIGIVDARVLLADGGGAGSGWTAQLYGAAEGRPLVPLAPATTFRTSTAAAQGYVNPVDVIVPGVNPGEKVSVVMTVYNGDSYETSALAGQSDPITVTLGGGTLPPANLVGMEGFVITSDEPPAGDVGLVHFNNRVSGDVDARVLHADGTGVGPGWKAQLYGGAVGDPLIPLLPATTFRTTSADAMGYVNPVDVPVPGVAPGEQATLVMMAYNGETLDASTLSGRSAPVTITLGGGTLPPASLEGLQGFTIAGNPPVIFRQPASQTAVIGSTAIFSVIASGAGEVRYQWSFNGSPISGAISAALVLSDLQASQAGSYSVAVSNAFGTVLGAPAELTLISPAVRGDFNGDGMADILFQDDNGTLAVWFMEGAELQSGRFLNPIRTGDKKWRVAGLGDFNQDGNEDILFQHESGTLSVWFMNGIRRASATFLDPTDPGDKAWRVVATDDFNQDGAVDIVLQHEDGWIAIWYMAGIHLESAEFFRPNHPGDPKWAVVGSGDFNSDQKADLAFQHDDGTLALWYLDGITLTRATLLDPSLPNEAPWRAKAITDLDRDGMPDLIFQHRGVGTLAVWFMDGETLRSAELLNPSRPGGAWEVVGP